ncbi:hypothetical protein TRFO_29840 [Tritrichomonas foetus]|uniref:Uncharacterized protein n=1 Tax=Tritrichomonas foetus TaxID=1144522 RepID=A0A1J4JV82_9EUKA|nr:hypothetical protein TRFO_29840 [Tritrichomonas foetus]|eukprot:OHT02915.1 hypothetical protein TRFO_29840 [Tritrichomonas foetus]
MSQPPVMPPISIPPLSGLTGSVDSSPSGCNSARPTPPSILPRPRGNSMSLKPPNNAAITVPKRPSQPNTPNSPRKRFSSLRQSASEKTPANLCKERMQRIIEVLDRNDVRDTMYKKCDNCCIFPNDVSEKSYNESKFMRREYPSYFSTDRQFFRFLFQQFSEAIDGLNERFPNYYSNDNIDDFQMRGMVSELDMWFTLFDECINQESQHSKVNSYILKNLMEVFQQAFQTLVNQVKRERENIENVKRFYEEKDDSSELSVTKRKLDYVVAENERLKREMDKIQEESKRFHIENFNLKREIEESQNNINGLLSTTDQLRQAISAGEQRIHEMTRDKPEAALEATFTAVPKDIMETWTQCSQFLTAVMENSLTNIDFNKLYPEDIVDDTLGYYLKLERPAVPTYEGENIHFSKLYNLIKLFRGSNEPNQVFTTLEAKIRTLFKKFALFYVDRNKKNRQKAKETENRLKKQLLDLRRSIPNPSEWISNVLSYPELYVIPKKSPPNVQGQIMFVFQRAEELMKELNKPNSASEIVTKVFQEHDLLLFLAQIAKSSRTDIYSDIFRKFLIQEFPFHMFLYYGKVILQNDKANIQKRGTFLTSQFQHVGWNSIPQLRRRSYETMYCPSPVTFPIFTLTVYQHVIENIAIAISNTVDQKDLKESLMKKYNDADLVDYLIAISEKGDPTVIEYASIVFDKKEKFEKLVVDFDPQQSKIIEYMSTFGQKKDKKKTTKKSKPRSQSAKCHRADMSNELGIPSEGEMESLPPAKDDIDDEIIPNATNTENNEESNGEDNEEESSVSKYVNQETEINGEEEQKNEAVEIRIQIDANEVAENVAEGE